MAETESSETCTLVQELVAREINESTARELAKNFPEAMVREKIAFFDQLVAKNDQRINKNPPGWLITAIKRDFKPSKGEKKKLVTAGPTKTYVAPQVRIEPPSKEDVELLLNISQLSPEGIAELTHRSLASATRLQRETYERLSENGSQLLVEYRKQLLLNYLRSVRSQAA